MKKILLTALTAMIFISCAGNLQAQEIDKKQAKVLVIPFQPSMYFCDKAQFICLASNITPAELNKTLRLTIASTMLGSLKEDYYADEISEKGIANKTSDVEQLYSLASYSLEEKPIVAFYKKNTAPSSGFKNLWGLKSSNNAPEYLNHAKPNLRKHRYFKAWFADTARVQKLLAHYNSGYVLFINHFEMETRFKDCIEMQKNVSERDLYVHYTLLDASGKFRDGGVVCITYASNSNQINDIMKDTLPSLSAMILQEVKAAIGKI